MAAINDITKDKIESRTNTNKFRDGWDAIFSQSRDKLKERADNGDPLVKFSAGDFEGMTREEAKEEMKRELFGG